MRSRLLLLFLAAAWAVSAPCGVASAQDATEAEATTTESAPAEEGSSEEAPAEEASSEEDAPAEEAGHDDDHDHGDHDGHGHDDAGHGDGHGEAAPDPLATDPDLAIWTLIVFLAMLAILKQVAWKPITDALAMREATIAGNYSEAEAAHEKAKGLLAEHEAKLAGAADQVRELLAEAHRDAEATRAQADADAKAEAEATRQRAVRDIEQARDAAVRQLAESTAGLAIDLAGKVVGQEISAARHGEIVGEALGRFKESNPSAN